MTTKDFVGREKIAKMLGVTPRHSFVTAPFNEMDKQAESGATEGEILVGGEKVQWQLTDYEGRNFPLVPVSAVASFRKQFDLRPVAENGYLTRKQMAQEIGIQSNHRLLNEIWSKFKTQMENGQTEGAVRIKEGTINWHRYYTARNLAYPYVHRSSIKTFRKLIAKIPRKATGEEYSITRIAEMAGASTSHRFIRHVFSFIESEVDNHKRMSGTILLGGTPVEWKMLQPTWAGSSKWGNVSPHFTLDAVEPFSRAIKENLYRREYSISELQGKGPALQEGTNDPEVDTDNKNRGASYR